MQCDQTAPFRLECRFGRNGSATRTGRSSDADRKYIAGELNARIAKSANANQSNRVLIETP
jgi:hypothetical protein